jgi:hypothetical protein
MPLKRIEDILALHHDFATAVAAAVLRGDVPTDPPQVRDVATALAMAKRRLARAEEGKQEAIRRYDDEIARYAAKVEELGRVLSPTTERSASARSGGRGERRSSKPSATATKGKRKRA